MLKLSKLYNVVVIYMSRLELAYNTLHLYLPLTNFNNNVAVGFTPYLWWGNYHKWNCISASILRDIDDCIIADTFLIWRNSYVKGDFSSRFFFIIG